MQSNEQTIKQAIRATNHKLYDELMNVHDILEKHYRDMQVRPHLCTYATNCVPCHRVLFFWSTNGSVSRTFKHPRPSHKNNAARPSVPLTTPHPPPHIRSQDIEFTVQEGKLYVLQCRSGKRTAKAAVKVAVDMVGCVCMVYVVVVCVD